MELDHLLHSAGIISDKFCLNRLEFRGAGMKSAFIALLSVVLFPSTSLSQSLFDGTWVIATDKNRNFAAEKPVTFLLADGIFRDGNRVLKADGTDQKVPPTGSSRWRSSAPLAFSSVPTKRTLTPPVRWVRRSSQSLLRLRSWSET